MSNKFSQYVNTESLRRERFAKKLTCEEMALSLGKYSPSSYSNIENGVVEPKISDMNTIAKILGKPVQYFFTLEVQETQTLIA